MKGFSKILIKGFHKWKMQNEGTNLKALKPIISLAKLFKEQEAMLSSHKLDILVQSAHQWLLIIEILHKQSYQFLCLR